MCHSAFLQNAFKNRVFAFMYAHMYTCTYMYVALCPDDATTPVEAAAAVAVTTAPPSYHPLRIEYLVRAPAAASAFCASFTCSASSAFLEALSYQLVAPLTHGRPCMLLYINQHLQDPGQNPWPLSP